MATAIHQYEDKLLDFAYGELPAPEASAVESHLKSCVRCTQALDQIRGVRATMSTLPQEPAPTNGLDSLLAYAEQAAARNAAAPRPGLPWWRRMIAPLAGACALTLVAVVAVKTQDDGIDLSAESAALEATPRSDEKLARAEPPPAPPQPAPIVAAAPQLEEEAAPGKSKKPSPKTNNGLKAAFDDRKAKEDRGWDRESEKQQALSKNNEGYEQALGETRAPAQERQRKDLGDALAAAQKESKSRREAPTDDFANARGAYVQEKKAEESNKQAAKPTKVAARPSESDSSDKSPPPMGLSTASPKPAPSAPVAKAPAPAPTAPPPAQVAANEPQAAPPSSLRMGLDNNSGGAGTGSSSSLGGTRSSSPSSFKKGSSRDTSDDDVAGRGANEIADGKRLNDDVEIQQRKQELEARSYLDAARSASNQNNHQEEVKLAMAALETNVKGAPRAEALSRLCSALEELGNEGQADKYCDALLREFPNTAAAKVVANRRNSMRAKNPARAADEAAEKKKAEPAKARPVEAAEPASAY